MKNKKTRLAKWISLFLTAALLAGVLLVTAAAAEASPVLEKNEGSFLGLTGTDASLSGDAGAVMANASGDKAPGVFWLNLSNGSQTCTVSAFYFTDGSKSYIVADSLIDKVIKSGYDELTLVGLKGDRSVSYLGKDKFFTYYRTDELDSYTPLKMGSTPVNEVAFLFLKSDDSGNLKLYGKEMDLGTCETENDYLFLSDLAVNADLYYGMPVISNDSELVGETYINEGKLMVFRFAGIGYEFVPEYALSAEPGTSSEPAGDDSDHTEGSGSTEGTDGPGEERKQKSESEDKTKLYLIIGAAAVAAFLFYNNKKKGGKKPEQSREGSISLEPSGGSPADGTIPGQNAAQPSYPLIGQDIYGPTVPNPSQPTVPKAQKPTVPVPENGTVPLALWQLRGVEGPLSGRVYPLSGSLTIGRGAQCGVRFSQDAPGISGTHCQVTVKGDKVYLQDLGSSYGTFYPQNNRLNPKTDCLLHEGGVFTLAQGGGAFRLEKAGAAADASCIVIKDMNGRTYRSDASMRITLGRNPGCQGGFGSGESSVSGRHCELYREGGKLYLRDLGSTNGTFFSQQERLRPNEPYRIRKGMAFFLTTPKYTFVVVEE